MRNLMHYSMFALLASFAFAGCTEIGGGGNGGDSDDTTDDDDDTGFNGTVGGNVTAPPVGNATGNGNVSRAWTYNNITGTMDHGNAPTITPTDPVEEPFDVANGTDEMYVNVSVMGSDLDVYLRPPGCESEDCAQNGEAVEGTEASFRLSLPDEGEWVVEL